MKERIFVPQRLSGKWFVSGRNIPASGHAFLSRMIATSAGDPLN
jgi:hypothetical protein